MLGGIGGNVGAQSSTVVIRGLSTQSISSLGLCGPLAVRRWRGVARGVDDAVGGSLRLVAGRKRLVGLSVGMSLLAITTQAATAGAAFRCCLTMGWIQR